MRKRVLFIFVWLSLSGNVFGQKTVKNDTVRMTGKVAKEQFVHGKVVEGVYDYFFQYRDKEYFIKEYGSAFSKDSLDKWIGKLVEIKAVIKEGTWDTMDDPEKQQSRVGEYITILQIKIFTP